MFQMINHKRIVEGDGGGLSICVATVVCQIMCLK